MTMQGAVAIEVSTPGELDGSEPVDELPEAFATWGCGGAIVGRRRSRDRRRTRCRDNCESCGPAGARAG